MEVAPLCNGSVLCLLPLNHQAEPVLFPFSSCVLIPPLASAHGVEAASQVSVLPNL